MSWLKALWFWFPKADEEVKIKRLYCQCWGHCLSWDVFGLSGWASRAQCSTTSPLYSAELSSLLWRMCNNILEELLFQHSLECFLTMKMMCTQKQTSTGDFFSPQTDASNREMLCEGNCSSTVYFMPREIIKAARIMHTSHFMWILSSSGQK